MAVYTTLTQQDMEDLLSTYALGELLEYSGVTEGVSNSTYQVRTTEGCYALSIFEGSEELQTLSFGLSFMQHLALHKVPCPRPIATRQGYLLSEVQQKPAAMLPWCAGEVVTEPSVLHCAAIGRLLAQMHTAQVDFAQRQPDSAGLAYHEAAITELQAVIPADDWHLLNQVWQQVQPVIWHGKWQQGVIHADLFPDNVLFQGGIPSAVIDFNLACVGYLTYDLAIAVNAWCVDEGQLDMARTNVLLDAYQADFAWPAEEQAEWPMFLRAASLRFWILRLLLHYFPPAGVILPERDPDYFKRLLFANCAG